MSSTPESNRFAPPAAAVEDVDLSPAGTLAGRGTRLGAAIIDVLIALLAFGVLALVSPINIFVPNSTGNVLVVLVQNLVLGFLLFLVVHGYLLATQGQTVGKALLKIRIVRSNGSRATFGRIVGARYLPTSVLSAIPVVGMFYGLVDALFIFTKARRCLHDLIADTIVVKA